MNNTRTANAMKNATASLASRGVSSLLKLALRTAFVFALGQTYLGIDALFASFVAIFSLADLGFNIALPQRLYQPLADKDTEKVRMLMAFYAKVYRIIFMVVIIVGAILYPFLSLILGSDSASIPDVSIIYGLFVLQAACSYLFIYKRTLIIADQKNYIVAIVELGIVIVYSIVQILILVLSSNYIAYLVTGLIGVIVQNCTISAICTRLYPFLKQKSLEKLDRQEFTKLAKDIYALFLYKVAGTVEKGTDNIIITAFVSLNATGLCSNFTLITTFLATTISQILSSVTASIGNHIALSSEKDVYRAYRQLNLIGYLAFGTIGICLLVCIKPVIALWLGAEYGNLEFSAIVVLVMTFYLSGVQSINSNYRNAYGLFYQGRYRPVLMVIINIASSIALAQALGVTGVFLGTLLSRLFTVGIIDPYIVHKYGFHQPLVNYYKQHVSFHAIALIAGMLAVIIFGFMPDNTIPWIAIKIVSSCVFALAALSLPLIFTPEMKGLAARGKRFLQK